MRKSFILAAAVVLSVFFFACEKDAIPQPPSFPTAQTADSLALPDPPEQLAHGSAASKKKPAHPVPVGDFEQSNNGRYTIQIAVFPSEASARTLVNKMAKNNIKAYYVKVNNPGQLLGSYYRVRIGFFSGKSIAENFARARLEPLGYKWWVDDRRNDYLGTNSESVNTVAAPRPAASSPSKRTLSKAELEEAKRVYRELAREAVKSVQR
jgi:hypothetical protein